LLATKLLFKRARRIAIISKAKTLILRLIIVKSNQKSGDNSTNLQAGGNIVINNGAVALYSIEEVAKQLLNSVFGELPVEAKVLIENNQLSYFQALTEKLSVIIKQGEELNEVINSPDFQYMSKIAAISASRSPSAELHKNLASLIVQRINNDKEDLKRIVYDEAILTVNKLTTDQLKIIALCYLLRYTNYSGITSWDTFEAYLNSRIKPFMDFKNTNAEFQHIQYTGCGSIDMGSWNLVDVYKREYSFLFFKLVSKAIIDDVAIPTKIKQDIVILDSDEDKYFIRIRNKNNLEKYLKNEQVVDEVVSKLISIYDEHIESKNEIKDKIEETDIGKKLLALCEKSSIKHLSLTSVGIAIAASYFEQITGEKINIDIWIN
jgi:hypothetical protein